jgi:hypothetical protein
MSEELTMNRIEDLRQAAIAKDRVEQFDEALALFDEALSLAEDEETRELITINKAHAMIGAQRSGPEVQALPMVLMRRRNPRHTFLASYALLFLTHVLIRRVAARDGLQPPLLGQRRYGVDLA